MSKIVRSPCISYCKKDKNGICQGCFRSIDEIRSWLYMSNEEKEAVLKNCEERIENLPLDEKLFVKNRNFAYNRY